jgi:cyclic pyranopterin phosphate synthase
MSENLQPNKLTHVNQNGQANMVDVSQKALTLRIAKASGFVRMNQETLNLVKANQIQKGDVLSVAKIAGILAAKKVDDLIPLCHSLPLDSVFVDCVVQASGILVCAEAKTSSKTGVEMEALMAVNITCLTIYDMCKASQKDMTIENIRLDFKSGGKSGTYIREDK